MGAIIVAYMFLVNDTTSGSYKVSEVENRIEAFQRENKLLELKVAELKSMKNVQARLIDQDFVPVLNVEYVRSGAPSVALR